MRGDRGDLGCRHAARALGKDKADCIRTQLGSQRGVVQICVAADFYPHWRPSSTHPPRTRVQQQSRQGRAPGLAGASTDSADQKCVETGFHNIWAASAAGAADAALGHKHSGRRQQVREIDLSLRLYFHGVQVAAIYPDYGESKRHRPF